MQSQPSEHQRTPEGDIDRRWDHERATPLGEVWVAFQKAADSLNRPVHLAEPGKPVNMSARLFGKGGMVA